MGSGGRDPTPPPGWQPRVNAVHVVAGKSQVRANVRVARRELFGEAIICNGAADPARFEQRIAEVEVKGRGHATAGDNFFVGCCGLGKRALFIKFVGLLERGRKVASAREAGNAEAEEQNNA